MTSNRTSDVPSGAYQHAENLRPFRFKCCSYWQTNYRQPGRCGICGEITVKTVAEKAIKDKEL